MVPGDYYPSFKEETKPFDLCAENNCVGYTSGVLELSVTRIQSMTSLHFLLENVCSNTGLGRGQYIKLIIANVFYRSCFLTKLFSFFLFSEIDISIAS